MGNTSVPLWAFLLTALAAVVGPFVTTWLTHRHTLEMVKRNRESDRRAWLIDHRVGAYDVALQAIDQMRGGLLSDRQLDRQNLRRGIDALTDARNRVGLFGSPEALTALDAVRDASSVLARARVEQRALAEDPIVAFNKAKEAFQRAASQDVQEPPR